MQFSFTQLLLVLILFISLLYFFVFSKLKFPKFSNLPPGTFGWPIFGETLAFMRLNLAGIPEKFMRERMEKYDSRVFKTSLFGDPMAVFCGAEGNKFLFGNENKIVAIWWPKPVQKLFGCCLITTGGDEGKRMRKLLMSFLSPDALMRYIKIMDQVTINHMESRWEGKEEVKVYPTIKLHTFELACRLFMSIDNKEVITKLFIQFNVFLKGVISIPINFPGTRFYSAMRATNAIRKQLRVILRQRRLDLEQKIVSPSQDLLSHLLVTPDEMGRFMTEMEIINNILTLLFAGHDTSSSTITLLMKHLAELPEVYEKVLTEQSNIALSKAPSERLQWEDIQKMKYSWNVISEVMRISTPVPGAFREALTDFTYEGYTIPKGWKLYWSAVVTHMDSSLHPRSEVFDPSRYEGAGPAPFTYVPFGGGPRMCVGKEFARIEMLVFLHNVVNRFKWELLIPNEKFVNDPMPGPVHGLPVSLCARKSVASYC